MSQDREDINSDIRVESPQAESAGEQPTSPSPLLDERVLQQHNDFTGSVRVSNHQFVRPDISAAGQFLSVAGGSSGGQQQDGAGGMKKLTGAHSDVSLFNTDADQASLPRMSNDTSAAQTGDMSKDRKPLRIEAIQNSTNSNGSNQQSRTGSKDQFNNNDDDEQTIRYEVGTPQQFTAGSSVPTQPSSAITSESTEAEDTVPILKDRDTGNSLMAVRGNTLPKQYQSLTSSNYGENQTQISVNSSNTMTTVPDATNNYERVDVVTGEPNEADQSLNSPVFAVPASDQDHVRIAEDLSKVLKFDYKKMTVKQRESCKQYLMDFIAHYRVMANFKAAQTFQYNSDLISLIFELVSDDKNPFLDKILLLLMILSRNAKSHKNGEESRIKAIFELLKTPMIPQDVVREAIRSLINFAEHNSKAILDNAWLEVLHQKFAAAMNDRQSVASFLWLFRNLTVESHARKYVIDRMGFMVTNSANGGNLQDPQICEQFCWLLGNLALQSESVHSLIQMGVFPMIKQILTIHQEREQNVEAAFWFLFNVTFDQQSIKIIMRTQLEEHVIGGIKKFGPTNQHVLEWADYILRRIRAVVQASTPTAVAERNANKSIREGVLLVQIGDCTKKMQKHCTLQQARFIMSVDDKDQEIQVEIRLKDVVDVSTYPPVIKEIVKKADSAADSPGSGGSKIAKTAEIVIEDQSAEVKDIEKSIEVQLSIAELPKQEITIDSSMNEGDNQSSKEQGTDSSIKRESDVQQEIVKDDSMGTQIEIKSNDSSADLDEIELNSTYPTMITKITVPDKKVEEEKQQQQQAKVAIITPVKQIKITTRGRSYILESADQSVDMAGWLTDIKSVWKSAVSAVTENLAPAEDSNKKQSSAQFPFFFNVQDTVLPRDLEKFCLAHVIHDIYTNPQFLMYTFKCQKQYPSVAVWDYFVAKITRQLALDFIAQYANQYKLSDKDVYDAGKIKSRLSGIVENRLLSDAEEFDQNPDELKEAPQVPTKYEYCAKQGIRPTMEDRHIHLPYIDVLVDRKQAVEDPISYYAVYDGHGGIHVAAFVETHLHYNLMKHPELDTDFKKALTESFLKTQDELKEASDRLYLPTTAGSTGVVIVFRKNKMFVAWVGDSLASLYREKETIELVNPHKPGSATEKARIEKLGGFISEEGGILRVNGIVAVTRAFGNIRHKVITPDADILEVDMRGDEQYVVLACDGLWDVMTPDAVRKFVKKYMKKHGNRTKGISEALVDESLKLGSTDNVSVVFIEFYQWKEPKRT
ncbi:hypothetical protein MP228_001200 [Amoeboaphelidium protococcarum]|nr:hypothetical protein MP228_001200 [Amoeboaphelidium protococcarum]